MPWKSLGRKLADAGIFMKNWPEGVPFPPIGDLKPKKRKGKKAKEVEADENDDDDDDEPKKKVPKSLQALSLENLRFIYYAIHDQSHPLCFERYTEGKPSGMFVY